MADLHWEEGDGVVLPDVGELVLPGDTVLVEGHVVADLDWGEGDGVELPDGDELVLPGGKDKEGMS